MAGSADVTELRERVVELEKRVDMNTSDIADAEGKGDQDER